MKKYFFTEKKRAFARMKKLLATFFLLMTCETLSFMLNPSPTFGGLFEAFSKPSPRHRIQQKQKAIYKLQERLEHIEKELNKVNDELAEIASEKEKTNDPQKLEMLDIRQKIAAEKLKALKEETDKIMAEFKRLKFM